MNDLLSEESVSSPKISIGIVVYNGFEHIRSCLDSIVKQSYENIELIVVDGGSTDGTLIVLDEYSQYISVMVSEPDKGIYDAMNKVCALATGDWLIFLGCDDLLLDTMGNMAGAMTDSDVVYYGDVIFRSSGKTYGGKFSKYRYMQHNICHQALFYPRSMYKKYIYSLDYRWLADYVYNLKLMGDAVPFVYTGVVVSLFNDTGRSSRGDAEFEDRKISLIRSSFGTTYAFVEILRRWTNMWKKRLADKTASGIGVVLKFLLPYAYWRYFQSLWRRMRNR